MEDGLNKELDFSVELIPEHGGKIAVSLWLKENPLMPGVSSKVKEESTHLVIPMNHGSRDEIVQSRLSLVIEQVPLVIITYIFAIVAVRIFLEFDHS